VIDRLSEGQEELRAELGLLAEQLEELGESVASGRRRRDRILLYLVLASTVLAAAALGVTLLR
jgi:hypothetical protein